MRTSGPINASLSKLILVPDLDRQLLKRARPTLLDALERTDQDLFDARPTGMNFVLNARRALRSHNFVFRKQPFLSVSNRRSFRCRWIQAPLCQRRSPDRGPTSNRIWEIDRDGSAARGRQDGRRTAPQEFLAEVGPESHQSRARTGVSISRNR